MTSTQPSTSLNMKRCVSRIRKLAKGTHRFLTVFIALLFFSQYVFAKEEPSISTVKIFAACRKPDYYQPWQTGWQYRTGGSGCIIAGRRILTNAHIVSDQEYLQVRKAGDPRKYSAGNPLFQDQSHSGAGHFL